MYYVYTHAIDFITTQMGIRIWKPPLLGPLLSLPDKQMYPFY